MFTAALGTWNTGAMTEGLVSAFRFFCLGFEGETDNWTNAFANMSASAVSFGVTGREVAGGLEGIAFPKKFSPSKRKGSV